MFQNIRYLWIIILFVIVTNILSGQDLTVMTYNIRLDVSVDGDNAWSYRKDVLIDQIRAYEPLVIGVQEARPNQVAYMDHRLEGYSYTGQGRDGGVKGEHSAIFYNHTKIEIINEGTFWLSDTPNIPSKGWDAAFPRICSYALFKDIESKKQFWVFNTHLDHMGNKSRCQSAKLITKKMSQLNKLDIPVIVMGDMNATPKDKPIKIFKREINKHSSIDYMMPDCKMGTFNAFDTNFKDRKIIDYIFFSDDFFIVEYFVDEKLVEDRLASDHFPVIGKVFLK